MFSSMLGGIVFREEMFKRDIGVRRDGGGKAVSLFPASNYRVAFGQPN